MEIPTPEDEAGWTRVLSARAWVDSIEVASRMPEVVAFREKHLRGKKLSRGAAYAWAAKQAREQGEATALVVDLFTGDLSEHGFRPGVLREEKALTLDLPSQTPTTHAESYPAQADGPLGELRALAHRLADRFGWDVKRAAMWVLEGRFVESLISEGRASIKLGPRGASPTWNSVRIEVPAEISSGTVAEIHRDARRLIAEKQKTLTLKGPPVGERQIHAMIFACLQNDGRSWQSILDDWNRLRCAKRPEWRYETFRDFARDARSTYRRVMGRPWVHGLLGGNDDGDEATDEG